MLKPDLRTSEKVASWPREVRYFWVLLWGYVDDHGKGLDNGLLVKADCFPLDEDVTGAVIDCWLERMARDGVIARYRAGGKDLIQCVHWSEHQKPQHPKVSDYANWNSPGAAARSLHAACTNPACIGHEPFTPELSRDGLGWGDDARIAQLPPASIRCPEHEGELDPPNCGKCKERRLTFERWTTEHPEVKPELRDCSRDGHKLAADGYCVICGAHEQAVAS